MILPFAQPCLHSYLHSSLLLYQYVAVHFVPVTSVYHASLERVLIEIALLGVFHSCTGAPDWIIEIVSPSNSSHDYVKKLNLYMDAGVREYWIVNPQQQTILVYFFEEDIHVRQYTFDDTIKVNIYDDFTIDFSALARD
ncbi:MAG: Uma2 family endonuclease [Lachnospiraceae bacterium]